MHCQTVNGWCYISSAKCSKKLQRGVSFTCTTCFNASAVGVLRDYHQETHQRKPAKLSFQHGALDALAIYFSK
ncbi:hypothetical protein BRARA_I03234 [Brassica rapa]|uniref:Uncharacterized protein n=1 Tax=Brassica campestris TaxID=3711 RepID=A0A397XZ20_BRACM|nr:hypothetical protein BRARA_I03234 [Brassica rapa]